VARRDPTIVRRTDEIPNHAVPRTEWFERNVGEFTCQRQLAAHHDEGTDTWYVTAREWDEWDTELVRYFIGHGYGSPGVEAFIRAHVLSAGE